MLHTLWSKAVGQPGYDKQEWLFLERQLVSLLHATNQAYSLIGQQWTGPSLDVSLELAAAIDLAGKEKP